MRKLLLSRKNHLAGLILLSGLLVAGAILIFSNFNTSQIYASSQIQWTQPTGFGTAVPACSSSSPNATCSGTSAQVTISWSYGGQHGTCQWARVRIDGGPSADGQPCSGSYTFGGLQASRSYNYRVEFWYDPPLEQACSWYATDKYGNPTGICASWDWGDPLPHIIEQATGSFTTPGASNTGQSCTSSPNACGQTSTGTIQCNGSCSASTPSNPPGYGNSCTSSPNACGQTSTGTIGCNGQCSATTPSNSSCPRPGVDIKANGSDGPITVNPGAVTLSWSVSSSSAVSCTASGSWSGSKPSSGSETVNVAASTSNNFVLSCTNAGGTSSDTVRVDVYGPPSVTVSVGPNPADPGETVTWTANPAGGTGAYTYLWSFPDSDAQVLDPLTTKTVRVRYSNSGTKIGTVTVTSGGQTASATGSVAINPGLGVAVACSPDPAVVGDSITCRADPAGGTGQYTYSWTVPSGCTAIDSTSAGPQFRLRCSTIGSKVVSVVVTSRTQTAPASDSITINPPQPPEADIRANNSTGSITLPYGSSVTIEWCGSDAHACARADSCTVTPNNWAGTSGTRTEALTVSKTYTLSCANLGGTRTSSVTVNIPPTLPTASLNATPFGIRSESTFTLSWSSTNAQWCDITNDCGPDIGRLSTLNGSTTIRPSTACNAQPGDILNYTLTCLNEYGTATATTSVEIFQRPSVDLSGPSVLEFPDPLNLNWQVANADTCTASCSSSPACDPSGLWRGSKSTSGGNVSIGGLARGDYSYTLSCSGRGGDSTDTLNVSVRQIPKCSFTADPTSIISGETSMLSWSCQYALPNTCSIIANTSGQGIGPVDPSGTRDRNPTQTTVYTLTCQGLDGPASYTAAVSVSPLPRIREISPR